MVQMIYKRVLKAFRNLDEEPKSSWKSERRKYENRSQTQKIIVYSWGDFSDSLSNKLTAISVSADAIFN